LYVWIFSSEQSAPKWYVEKLLFSILKKKIDDLTELNLLPSNSEFSFLQTKRAKVLSIDDHRRGAFWARSKDQFSTSTLQGTPDNDIILNNEEFHGLTAVTSGIPSPIWKQHFGA
jgi:hypothetical protein